MILLNIFLLPYLFALCQFGELLSAFGLFPSKCKPKESIQPWEYKALANMQKPYVYNFCILPRWPSCTKYCYSGQMYLLQSLSLPFFRITKITQISG